MIHKTILVTGGTRGIGRAIAQEFLTLGARVAITYERQEGEATALLAAYPDTCLALQGDIAEPDTGIRWIEAVLSRFGSLDVLINNAGISESGLLQEMKDETIDRLLSVNLKGTLQLTRAAIPSLLQSQGQILNIGSVWGHKGASMETVYAMTKGAIGQLTTSLAKELGPMGVRTVTIAPGLIDTQMNQGLELESFLKEIPLGRMGTPREVAVLIRYLVEHGSYINGETITIDGGYAI